MTKEIQALTKKVEKLKAQKKAQVCWLCCAAAAVCSRGCRRCVLQDQKVAELQVWEESVPVLRAMLEEAM